MVRRKATKDLSDSGLKSGEYGTAPAVGGATFDELLQLLVQVQVRRVRRQMQECDAQLLRQRLDHVAVLRDREPTCLPGKQ